MYESLSSPVRQRVSPSESQPTPPPQPPSLADSLIADSESWLDSGAWWGKRLPAALRDEYNRETRRERSRTACLVSFLGGLVALCFYPMLTETLPDMRHTVNLYYLGLAVPFTFLVSALALLNPRPLLREVLIALPSIVDAGVLTWLFTRTSVDATELYVAAILLLMLFATVTLQLRFSVAAGVTSVVMLIYGWGVQLVHADLPHYRQSLLLIVFTCWCYMLIANWRMQVSQQRGFVLALREQLRRLDLTQRNLELDELVRRDALTGLANRRAYDTWLQNSWRQARATTAPVGLIILDVDRFKDYNDFYGHPAGDVCLQAIARCLREQLRGTTDHVARVGGEEFAVLLPGLDAALCGDIAERLRAGIALLELPHLNNGRTAIVTISCGVASLPASEKLTPRDLVAAADAALYHAKQSGRNFVCLADTP